MSGQFTVRVARINAKGVTSTRDKSGLTKTEAMHYIREQYGAEGPFEVPFEKCRIDKFPEQKLYVFHLPTR